MRLLCAKQVSSRYEVFLEVGAESGKKESDPQTVTLYSIAEEAAEARSNLTLRRPSVERAAPAARRVDTFEPAWG